MKKVAALVALSLLMAGCVSSDKIAVTPEQLQHHRFVLESVNGKPVTSDKNPPEISFGEKMMISGSMCNRFSGEGKLSNGELTAKGLAMTRMMCANPQLNELDNTIRHKSADYRYHYYITVYSAWYRLPFLPHEKQSELFCLYTINSSRVYCCPHHASLS